MKQVRTEWVDGLEFEVPTWDPTPVPWNETGSWAKDPEVTERILAGLRRAVPNHEELVAEALTATAAPVAEWCGTYWGSHGCGREKGHSGLCVCSPGEDYCMAALRYGDDNTLIVWFEDSEVGYRLGSLLWRWYE